MGLFDFLSGGGGGSNLDWLGTGAGLFGDAGPAITAPTDSINFGSLGAGALSDPTQNIPTGGGGFNFGGALDSAAGFAKNLAPFAGLGLTGMGIAGGIQGQQQAAQQNNILKKAQQFQQQAAQPAINAGSALTAAGQQAVLGGALPPQMEAQVTAWGEQARAQLRQYFAQAGISDSTMMGQMEAWINEQMMLMRNNLAQGELQAGLEATRTGLAGAGQQAQTAEQEQRQLQGNMAAANAAIAALTAQQRPMGNG